MSGLLDKAKAKLGQGDNGAKAEKQADKYANQGIDKATDSMGMGDKYDDKINKVADKQLNNQIPGGQGPAAGGKAL
ncbi:hypothetical protein LTR53_003320 [Teratosphaeriaceae sp. CCFEE 6253]|nr:hypothetical protein LTR53_008217 [Teratosphaeriaceae sp. CCFEE 6253]KAK3074330.1 hypothetical protein LTR53_003320 [Teratosphaeriaceae sp. CCFEE 6253]